MRTLFCILVALGCTIQAGDQNLISRTSYQSKSFSKRGKKRSQAMRPTLEQFARNKFPGPDVQLGQKRAPITSTEKRKRSKAWQEAVLLQESTQTGSYEQFGAIRCLLQAKVHPDMKYLKECGISVEGSPLRNAARAGNKELVELLLDAGADPNSICWFSSKRGYVHETPIHAAARAREMRSRFTGRYAEVIKLLHAHGADMNLGGESQDMPFAPIHMIALQRCSDKADEDQFLTKQIMLIKTLISCGAVLDKHTANGDTAIDLAKKRGNRALARALEIEMYREKADVFIEHPVQKFNGDRRQMRRTEKARSKELRAQIRDKKERMSGLYS